VKWGSARQSLRYTRIAEKRVLIIRVSEVNVLNTRIAAHAKWLISPD
jgi:hypothetical protein